MSRYLFALDFDNTLFNTSAPSPNGLSVRKAYELAFDDILGPGGWDFVDSRFGFQNRAPSELVYTILTADPETREACIGLARDFYSKTGGRDYYLIPECPDGKLKWDDENPERTITAMLIQRKLHYLLGEIGQRYPDGRMWPEPLERVEDFLKGAERLKKEGFPIDLGIISSGHNSFIEKGLQVSGIPFSGILVTEDDIRLRKYPKEIERRVKPGQLPLALVHFRWLKAQGLTFEDDLYLNEARTSKQRMVYIGDDLEKDGFMALHGRIPFYWYTRLTFPTLLQDLETKRNLFDGRPLTEILTPHSKILEACSTMPLVETRK